MADKIEALPCPHCGEQPMDHAIEAHKHALSFNGAPLLPDHPGSHVVECVCGAGMIDDTKEAVLARWNRRALAQGEPGEAPDGRLHADGYFTWNTGKRPNYRADLKLPCDFYLSPTASAPAAERAPRSARRRQ